MLSERAALFARSSGNAAALARIYLSVRSAWTKRSLSRDARTLTRWPLGMRSRRRKLAALGQTFVSIGHVQFGQKADILRARTGRLASPEHTFKISLQICEGGFVVAPKPCFASPPRRFRSGVTMAAAGRLA